MMRKREDEKKKGEGKRGVILKHGSAKLICMEGKERYK